MTSDAQLREMLLAKVCKGAFEELARKMRFSDKRFAVLPISCVAREFDNIPSVQMGHSTPSFQTRVFEIMKSIIYFRKVLDAVDVCPQNLQQMSAAVHEDLETPFTGFILEMDGSGTFVRLSPWETIAIHNRKAARSDELACERERAEQSCRALLEQHRERVHGLEAELKDTNKAYARIVEENDALSDEVDIANTKIMELAREKDRKWSSMQQQLHTHEATIAMMEVNTTSNPTMRSQITATKFSIEIISQQKCVCSSSLRKSRRVPPRHRRC